MIQWYRSRISGPVLDRIDLYVEVPLGELRDLSKADGGENSATIRQRVEVARAIQVARFEGRKNVTRNSAMTPRHTKQYGQITPESQAVLERFMEEMNFSACAHDRILKEARTLADLAARNPSKKFTCWSLSTTGRWIEGCLGNKAQSRW